ncbi:hypothetical protein [Novosphingobium sp.]|uniref:hypothetical protein n=1 Tax=Novosphingobium sp. TaxID=1874826 RepID=UPI00286D2142|nr:hypothetical protein [Novosphingobium sp.]
MSAKLFFLTGLLGIGGYVGYKATSYDPAAVPYSKAEVQTMLASARTTIPRRDNDGNISIWGTGRTSEGVTMAMQYSADAPVLECRAVITEVGPKQSRVVANCGAANSTSAIANTQVLLLAPMFDEHIQSKLQGRAFDRKRAQSREMGVVMGNMGGMQKEALKAADQVSGSSSGSSSDWGASSRSGSSPSSGGWGADTPSGSK